MTSLPNYSAGYLNFVHVFRKTWIFRELSGINLWNKKQFVWKESDIAQDSLKFCNNLTVLCSLPKVQEGEGGQSLKSSLNARTIHFQPKMYILKSNKRKHKNNNNIS